jgi:hypothetical protein
MKQAMLSLAQPEASNKIADLLVELAHGSGEKGLVL